MKKFLAIMLALILSMTAVTAFATDLDGLMDFLNSVSNDSGNKSNSNSSTNPFDALTQIVTSSTGSNSSDKSTIEDTGELPSLIGPFSGKTVKVKVNNTTYTIHEEFKTAMDEYEKFFDEYIALMSNVNDPNYFTNYMKFMSQYEKTMTALEAAEKMTDKEKQWSKDENAYFTVVMLQIDKKLYGSLY